MDSSLDRDEGAAWNNYSETKPEAEGVYEWRVPSRRVSGLIVTFLAWMEMRNAGYSQQLAPSFSHWDGYRLTIPAGVQWRRAAADAVCKTHEYKAVAVEGVTNCACPFCGKSPSLRGAEFSLHGGVFVGSAPYDFNSWQLECCSWARTPRLEDPRELYLARNAAIGPSVNSYPSLLSQRDALVEALEPDLLEAIADEIDSFEHSARATSLRILAERQRAALASASEEKKEMAG